MHSSGPYTNPFRGPEFDKAKESVAFRTPADREALMSHPDPMIRAAVFGHHDAHTYNGGDTERTLQSAINDPDPRVTHEFLLRNPEYLTRRQRQAEGGWEPPQVQAGWVDHPDVHRLAWESPHPYIRDAAARMITDPEHLEQMAIHHPDHLVSMHATQMLGAWYHDGGRNQDRVLRIANTEGLHNLTRGEAIMGLHHQEDVRPFLRSGNRELAEAAANRLFYTSPGDNESFQHVPQHPDYPSLASFAHEQMTLAQAALHPWARSHHLELATTAINRVSEGYRRSVAKTSVTGRPLQQGEEKSAHQGMAMLLASHHPWVYKALDIPEFDDDSSMNGLILGAHKIDEPTQNWFSADYLHHPHVGPAFARHTDLPHVLLEATTHPDQKVRYFATQNPHTDADSLAYMTHDEDPEVKASAARELTRRLSDTPGLG